MERRFPRQAAMERNRIPYHRRRNRNPRTSRTLHPPFRHAFGGSQQTQLSSIRSYDAQMLALSTPWQASSTSSYQSYASGDSPQIPLPSIQTPDFGMMNNGNHRRQARGRTDDFICFQPQASSWPHRTPTTFSSVIVDDGYRYFWRSLPVDRTTNQQNLRQRDDAIVRQLDDRVDELQTPNDEPLIQPTHVLSDEIIFSHLQRKSYVSSPNEQEPEICVICQADYEDKDDVGLLQCGHHYHTDCIKSWLREKNVCPLCKSTVLKI